MLAFILLARDSKRRHNTGLAAWHENMKRTYAILIIALATTALTAAGEGFVSIFNGRDLTGWTNVNCAPESWSVRDGVIHCTGHPTGALRTTRQYENFILELEWRHLTSGGNSGIFIWASPIAAPGVPFLRGIEVQVLDHGFNVPGKNEWYTTHGDVFPIHGATMEPFGRHNGQRSFPSEERSKGTPEWNHYRIVCTNGVLRLQVNGKEVSGGRECNYRKGFLGLESEGAPVEFRNLQIRELPESGAAPEVAAPQDPGWQSLFTGMDFRGWNTNAALLSRWSVQGERIALLDAPEAGKATLWTEAQFADAEFVVDCLPAKPAPGLDRGTPSVQVRGRNGQGVAVKLEGAEPGRWQRFFITVAGADVRVMCNGHETHSLKLPADGPQRGAFGLADTGGPVQIMNVYARGL